MNVNKTLGAHYARYIVCWNCIHINFRAVGLICRSKYHLARRRDLPEPGPPDTSKGGVGGGAATISFRPSMYYREMRERENTDDMFYSSTLWFSKSQVQFWED